MIDVLFLTLDDWANTGWRMMKCAQKIGLRTMGFKGRLHPFCYPEQLPVLSEIGASGGMPAAPSLKSLAENAKLVHFIASTFVDTGIDLVKDHYCVVNHGGKNYRENPDTVNRFFNQFADAAICQTPDLLNLGAKNEHLIYFPVDTDMIQPGDMKCRNPRVIGHFPSQDWCKNSNLIKEALDEVSNKHDFTFGTNNGSRMIWLEQLDSYRECDIIIDQMALTIPNLSKAGTVQVGGWGNTTMEAAAIGAVPVSCCVHMDVYRREYGPECGVQVANTKAELIDLLDRLLSMSDAELLVQKSAARNWVVEKHSIEATAKRLWDKVYKPYFEGVKPRYAV